MKRSLKSLQGMFPIVAQVSPYPGYKRPGENFFHYMPYNFEVSEIIITKIQYQENNNIMTLNYIPLSTPDSFFERTIHIDDEFIIEVLTGKKRKDIMAKYYTYLNENLSRLNYLQFRIGSDPEFFVEDSKGEIIPSFKFLGSKQQPSHTWGQIQVGSLIEATNQKMYWDGFQAEFETLASTCFGWLVDSIWYGLKGLYEEAKKFNPEAKISAKTLVEIPMKEFEATDPKFLEFGCMPSKNAYGLNAPLLNGTQTRLRSTGGHIHFGIGKMPEYKYREVVKTLDAILGVACVALFQGHDHPERRMMYGLPGEYRTPQHGLEYRVLSNAWMFHPLISNLVLDLSRQSFRFGAAGLRKQWKTSEEETIACIKNCDVKLAQEILSRNKDLFLKLLGSCYTQYMTNKEVLTLLYNIFYNGMDTAIKNPKDIVGNWCLEGEGLWRGHSNGTGKQVNTGVQILITGDKAA
jgi:hypothetical protein